MMTSLLCRLLITASMLSANCQGISNSPDAPSNNNNNNNLSTSQYTFNQHVSINPLDDSADIAAETESMMFYSEDDDCSYEETDIEATTTTLLYEGGSYVSTAAITCNGGDTMSSPYESVLNDLGAAIESVLKSDDLFEYDDEDDDSNDDDADDDDDDGHSSMLSNASLRRSGRSSFFAYSNTAEYKSNNNGDSNKNIHRRRKVVESTAPNPTSNTFVARRTKSSILSSSALSLRGGASSSDLGSEFAKRLLVAAIVTLVYEALIGHFLEFVKIVMQTSPPGTSYIDVIKSITSEKGIAGIWDGFVPWGVVQAVAKGSVFGLAHAVATSLLMPSVDNGTLPKLLALTIAGGIAGGFQGYVLSPTLLLKTRVMTNPIFREKMSLITTTIQSFRIGFDVVASEGIGALMKGANVFATKRVFDWSTRFYFSDLFEALILNRFTPDGTTSLSANQKIVASLLGGTASTISTLPLDVLVAKTQDAKKAGVKVSPVKMFRDELKEKGWGGLYDTYMQGFEARLAHVCFTTVVMKTGSPIVYDALFGKKE